PMCKESHKTFRDGAQFRLSSEFYFTVRGGRVQLTSTLRTASDYTPVAFTAKGKTYRFVNVDSDVTIDGRTAIVRADGGESRVAVAGPFFTVDGYAPFAAQMLLLRYWQRH